MVAYSGKQLKNTQDPVEKCNIYFVIQESHSGRIKIYSWVDLSWLHQSDPECEGSKFAGLYWSCLYIYITNTKDSMLVPGLQFNFIKLETQWLWVLTSLFPKKKKKMIEYFLTILLTWIFLIRSKQPFNWLVFI